MKNIRKWLSTPIHQLVIVDYNCPEKTGKEVLKKYAYDSRITVLVVNAVQSGPFFQPARARNIGAQAAKSEYLMFLDADCSIESSFYEDYFTRAELHERDSGEDLCTFIPGLESLEDPIQMPSNWQLYNQFLVRNALFYACNGFNEFQPGWGSYAVDLQKRVASLTNSVYVCGANDYQFHTEEHDDAMRDRYLPTKLPADEFGGKGKAYAETFNFFSAFRKISVRAQPGMRFGLESYSSHVRMFVGGIERNFNPGEL